MTGNESRVQAIYDITNRETVSSKAPEKLEDIWALERFQPQQDEGHAAQRHLQEGAKNHSVWRKARSFCR